MPTHVQAPPTLLCGVRRGVPRGVLRVLEHPHQRKWMIPELVTITILEPLARLRSYSHSN